MSDMNRPLTTTLLGAIIMVLLFPSAWAAESAPSAVADFYEGKSIQLIVGHGPGGGFDTYSRAIARHLGKHIPGNPTIIVMNMIKQLDHSRFLWFSSKSSWKFLVLNVEPSALLRNR